MRQVLLDGPCAGETTYDEPESPAEWFPAQEIVPPYPPDGPVEPGQRTPELHMRTRWYRLDRVADGTVYRTYDETGPPV